MDLEKRMRAIEEHFKNLSIEEFENNLIEAGIARIKPTMESGMRMVTEQELYFNHKERYASLGDNDLNVYSLTYQNEVA
ncbi:hypothetical protein PBV87_15505 [Niameybacter massiliensis]|uniref:Uncharacterized protein n=1 Tax=Holtiella tumoricola TaxID=3018743 RepID=A0AA42DPZ0_9FIRM|nr:hypothetical protein [Holtiella tumoricola]MDA3732882.1 hypothetical protein [Holtiella tumoricola]